MLSVCVCLSTAVRSFRLLKSVMGDSSLVGEDVVGLEGNVRRGSEVLVAEKARLSSWVSDSYLGVNWNSPVWACLAALSARKLPG